MTPFLSLFISHSESTRSPQKNSNLFHLVTLNNKTKSRKFKYFELRNSNGVLFAVGYKHIF